MKAFRWVIMVNIDPCDACDAKDKCSAVFDEIDNTKEIEQGDILLLPYIYPIGRIEFAEDKPEGKLKAWIQKWNAVVLSHSSTLAQNKLDLVLLCPIWGVSSFYANRVERLKLDDEYAKKIFKDGKFDRENFKNKTDSLLSEATIGTQYGYSILKKTPPCDKYQKGLAPMLVDFTNAYSLPVDLIKRYVEKSQDKPKRLRLTCEYRIDLVSRFNYFLQRTVAPRDELSFPDMKQNDIDYPRIDTMLDKVAEASEKKEKKTGES